MLIRRFYDDKLAQASYLVGCAATGEALVMDPNRDVDQYLRAAEAEGLRITQVTETHIHADFVSGARELADRAGAVLFLSAAGGPDWQYRFAAAAGAVLLQDGDAFSVGRIRFDVLHTPGHTPEHLTFLVTDTAGADRPMGAFTGDFIFVGDVGRPDLLERAAGVAGTMTDAARQLFASVQRFKELPDYLQLWPGHGAGSACGKALGAVPQTTLGYERLFNWALAEQTGEQFVRQVLEGQPDPPAYFGEMKRINRDGPPLRSGGEPPIVEDATAILTALARGAVVIDTRPPAAFAAAHLPGTLNIPLGRSFINWAGWLVPYDRDIYLIGESRQAHQAIRDLRLIGLDRVAGWMSTGELDRYRVAGGALQATRQIDVPILAELRADGGAVVVDVRAGSEWAEGHLPGSRNIPLGELSRRLGELPHERRLVVHCQSGTRSAIASSLLAAAGFTDVLDLPAGYAGWAAAAQPTERA